MHPVPEVVCKYHLSIKSGSVSREGKRMKFFKVIANVMHDKGTVSITVPAASSLCSAIKSIQKAERCPFSSISVIYVQEVK